MSSLIRQSLRFGAVGLVNTVIGLLVIYTLIYFFKAEPAIANGIGYAIGLVISFFLNRFWTFGDTRSIRKVIPRYLIIATTSYFLNLMVVLIGTRQFSMGPYLIQLFGVSVYAIAMFFGCKWFVFSAATKP